MCVFMRSGIVDFNVTSFNDHTEMLEIFYIKTLLVSTEEPTI